MQKFNNIIKTALIAIVLVFSAVGCVSEKYEFSSLRNVIIQLDVAVGAEITKSELSEGEQDIASLRIYAFRGNKLSGYYHQSTGYDGPVLMDLELPDGVSDVDFYLIANEAQMRYQGNMLTLSENMTRAQLEDIRFTSLGTGKSLPMYCVKRESINVSEYTASQAAGHQGHLRLNQEVSFVLTRSLAKLSVYAAKESGVTSSPQILSVALLTAGTREYSYLFPQTEAKLDQVPSDANDRVMLNSAVTVTEDIQSGTSAVQDHENYTPVVTGLYLPEVSAGYHIDDASYSWNSPSGDLNAAVLHVEYAIGENQDRRDGYVYLPRIERNNHVKVCILISASGQLIVNYVVADWDWDEDKMLDWFFDYPTHTYIWHMLPKSEDDFYKKPESAATMSETKPFTGYFQMTYPDNDKWTPTLEGLKASYCSIKVYDNKTGAEVFSSESPVPLSVSEDWYRVEVYPNPAYMDLGDSVNLAITYTPSGFTENEYLLINGSYPDYFWPGSTSENYITITMVN